MESMSPIWSGNSKIVSVRLLSIPSLLLAGLFLVICEQFVSPWFRCHPPSHLTTLGSLAYVLSLNQKKTARTPWSPPEIWAAMQYTVGGIIGMNPRRIRRKFTFSELAAMPR
jgi:hypothetical protein